MTGSIDGMHTETAGARRFVHDFSDDVGSANVLALCGGKGSGLMRMRGLGLPVPEGFVITTEACVSYIKTREMPEGLMDEVGENLRRVEEAAGCGFGDPGNPLLVSVRSGAAVSMPGMMDTVLNLGLNDATVRGLAESTGDERFARDSHRRFVQAFGEIVLKVPGHLFEDAIGALKDGRGVEADTELTSGDLEELRVWFEEIVVREAGTGEVVIWVCTEDEYRKARWEERQPVGMPWPTERMRLSSRQPWRLSYP